MALERGLLIIAALAAIASGRVALGCVREYGTVKHMLLLEATSHTGNEKRRYNGLDWPNEFKECRGKRQSPVLLPAAGAAAKALGQPDAKSTFSYGTITNANITNNGHTLQVSLPAGFKSVVKIPIKGAAKTATATSALTGKGEVSYVKASPAQFHFHAHSEHVMSGAEYPLEMHIVHFIKADQLPACGPKGCPAVLGVLLALTDNESEVKPELRRLIEAMPLNEGATGVVKGALDLNALLPVDSEGILCVARADVTTPLKISQGLLTKYEEAVGDLYCPEKKRAIPVGSGISEKGEMVMFKTPKADASGCVKLANGHSCRVVVSSLQTATTAVQFSPATAVLSSWQPSKPAST